MGHPRMAGVLDRVGHASDPRPGSVQVSPRDITHRLRVEPTEPQPRRGSLPLICTPCLPGRRQGGIEAVHVACEVGIQRSGDAGSRQHAALEAQARSRPSAACPQQLTFFSLHMDLREEAARLLFFFFLAPYKRTKPGSWVGPFVNRKHMFLREGALPLLVSSPADKGLLRPPGFESQG